MIQEQIELSKVYDPKKVEGKWYDYWMKKNYFHADLNSSKPPYVIVIPPPNVTGSLHMGHALNNTIQDLLIRWRRMQGYEALWLPGMDHAGIATQNKVEQKLAEEGLTRHDLGREKFVETAWEWKGKYGGQILNQLKRLGCSCDWSRERFTMDEGCSKAVREAFVRLYERGLIYRGKYMVNWCPRCLTALSDIEVEHKEALEKLYYVKYPLKDEESFISIATARPETMLGDTAVAVNPNDERYKSLIGKIAILPLVGRELPIIADEYTDPEFGTGALKITPAHDPNDFEIGQRHKLAVINVIAEDGTMNEEAGERYRGMSREDCRQKIIEDLKEGGYLIEIEDYKHTLGLCYRCHTILEPYISEQWFVRMKPLAEPGIKVVKEGKVKFIPERWTRIYLDWMENIKDWCISRQLWWGHRIPVWYCRNCGEMIVAREDQTECPKCGGEVIQDEDVLDTWFSSGLWPFSTLGWPDDTEDLKHFYPTSTLVTNYDIIHLWVARMIMLGLEFTGDIPYSDVYMHCLIQDALGRRMSKSLGTGVDPLELMEKFGTDAVRFTLMFLTGYSQSMRLWEDRFDLGRNFTNKIWNASRFAIMNLRDFSPSEIDDNNLSYELMDCWILSRYNRLVEEVTDNLDEYNFNLAAKSIYEFFWGELCDWYLELIKPRLYQNSSSRAAAQYTLYTVLEGTLRLLHPYMPFLTEEIWQLLPHKGESIMVSPWPETDKDAIDPISEEKMELITDVIRAIRSLRADVNIPLDKKVNVFLTTAEDNLEGTLSYYSSYIKLLGKVEELVIDSSFVDVKQVATAVTKGIQIFIPLAGLIDIEEEMRRLEKEIKATENSLARSADKLENEQFLTKAPAQVVEAEREKQRDLKEKLNKLEATYDMLKPS